MTSLNNIVGLILAGGRGRRMGGVDKAFLNLGGETILARTITRAKPQVSDLLINANGDPTKYADFSLPVVPDSIGGFLGPVAGIMTGIEWAREHRPKARWLATFACDTPFFPLDLVARLIVQAESESASVAMAASGGRHHPVFAVWRTDVPATSESVVRDQGLRRMDDFVALFANTRVEFKGDPIDPFFNINTPDDLARAEGMLPPTRPASPAASQRDLPTRGR